MLTRLPLPNLTGLQQKLLQLTSSSSGAVLVLLMFTFFSNAVVAQTQLINNTDRTFENATSSFAANNWSTAQPGNARQWQVGTAAGGSTKAAYVGTTSNYNGTNSNSVQHFYRDIVIPSGATNVSFSFSYRMPTRDNGSDFFYVYRTTTANTPVSGTVPGAGYTQIYSNTATTYSSFTTIGPYDLTALAGTTVRLVFTFDSDGGNPHANPAVDNVSLTYIPAPVITSLGSSSGCVGGNITINGTDLSSASAVTIGGTAVSSITTNTSTQIIAVIGSGTTGTVSVTTAGGTANSASSFTVNPLPTAFNVTGGGTYCSGGSGLAVGLSNSQSGVNYQLLRGATPVGTAVAGTGAAISFGLQTVAGTYTVRATNATTGCQRTQTGSAVITVNTPPSISSHPASLNRCVGQSATFSVTAAGTSPTYQWRKNGVDISGATGTSYNIASVVAGDAGTYDVVVTVNTCTPLTSNAATLTVNPLPNVYNVTGGGTTCSSGMNVGVSGSQVGVNYTLSPTGTVLAGTGASLNFGSQGAGTYTVNAANATTGCSIAMNGNAVVALATPPSITTQPSDRTGCVGTNVTFTIAASGGSLSYQWKKGTTNLTNGGSISGATSASLTITGLVVGDAGTDYNCEVTNICGDETSNYVSLTVNVPAVAPSAQPTSLTFPTIGVTSFIGSFTPSASAGYYLVVRTSTFLPPSNPANGTTYAVGSTALGAGSYVEYSGPDSTFSSNGLNQGTTYYYWIYGYNTSPCGSSPVYRTSSPLSGSATTLTNVSCGLTSTLYWAGTGSAYSNGAATNNFNTASNWSTSSTLYLASLSAPTQCNHVDIRVSSSSVIITLNANSAVNNLTFIVSSGRTGYLHTNGYRLTINGNANVDVNGGFNTTVGIGENGGSAAGIVDFKANVTIGTNAASSSLLGRASFLLGNSNSKLIFRADLLLGRTCVISSSSVPGIVEFDGIGLQEVLWNNDMYFANFNNVVVGNVNNPICRHVTGTYTPDNILGNLTVNGSSTLDLATSQWIRDAAGGTFSLNGTSKLMLGNDESIVSPSSGLGLVIPGSNFPGFSTISLSPTSTVEYYGDNTMTQTVYNVPTYGNLVMTNGSGSGTASRITTGALTVNGTSTVKNLVRFTPGANVSTAGTFNVENGATMVCGTNIVSGGGSFVLKSGGNIELGSTAGITSSGATGNIQTSIRSFSTGANYTYNSSGSAQTGNGLPTTVNNLTINNASGVTLFAGSTTYTVSGTLRLTAGSFIINGNTLAVNGLIRTSGSLRGSNTSSLTINGLSAPIFLTAGGRIIKNFTMGTNATATLLTDMEIPGGASFGTVTIGSGATLTTNSRLILRSTSTGSARVAEIPVDGSGNALGFISGNVQVERYISARRAWRFLSPTTTGTQTINQAWQEGQAANVTSPAGYGIQMTGPNFPNGFDLYSVNPSIKTYVPATDTWAAVTSTNAPFAAGTAYMTFIRGDRTVNAFGQAATSTILRSRGSLITGSRPAVTVNANQFAAISNPYASSINFKNVNKTSVDDKYYVWDPNLGTLGGYQTFIKNGSGDYEVVVGGGSYGAAGTVYNDIQNGQAFMVFSTGTSGTVTLQENDKSTGIVSVSRSTEGNNLTSGIKQLRTRLYGIANDGTVSLVDGVLNQFDEQFSNVIDGDDAKKGMSFGENLSVKNASQLLVVDRRKTVVDTDTIFLNLTGTKSQQYKFEFIPENMDVAGLSAYFEDSYLGTSVPLNLADTSEAGFSVLNIPGAYAPNRFRIVFRQQAPAAFAQITATRVANSTNVNVAWQVTHESNIREYELERSANGTNFSRLIYADPSANNCSTASYNFTDQEATSGANYYRVKAVRTNGQFFYSNTVMVQPVKGGTPPVSFSKNGIPESMDIIADQPVLIQPNPVQNKIVNISFGSHSGNYTVKISAQNGQLIYKTRVLATAESKGQVVKLALPSGTAPGTYLVSLLSDKNEQTVIKIVVL